MLNIVQLFDRFGSKANWAGASTTPRTSALTTSLAQNDVVCLYGGQSIPCVEKELVYLPRAYSKFRASPSSHLVVEGPRS